ncbi:MAG: carboxypeptidase regulatory-like domain-containing protein [Geobacteraceae bacterium]|nr:carboxypeptidase regulatory-like domain-containing protein [Geobacteraceae bacterium]
MSVQNPAFRITRWSVVGMEGMFVKMFDPPTEDPVTPDLLVPTNPVPEVMLAADAAGLFGPLPIGIKVTTPHTVTRDLMHGMRVPTWDGLKELEFFVFSDDDNPFTAGGTWPAATIRVPRGAVFHGQTQGKGPPPHTIHWHGIEPTPQNDGVGHCSMEIGQYTYQWQPNFIGTYFYHCHRNTVQHFEFGLYGMLLIEPPDAFFASQVLGLATIPVGHCRDGKRRTAANLAEFPQFPDFNSNLLTASDPWNGDPRLKFATDPHAMTVAYDVDALWVVDDRDSVWSDLARNPHATFPAHGTIPGVNDGFFQNGDILTPAAPTDFFAFHDFNADYWFVTGVPVPAQKGGTAQIPPGIVIPAPLNSGVAGTQVSISAETGQTIFLRCLDAAYNSARVTFPVNVVIIAWDGRALGQPPYGHNEAYLVPAGTPIDMSTARRFDALIRSTVPINDFATVEFINTRGQVNPVNGGPVVPGDEEVVMTARIPINIGGDPIPAPTFEVSGEVVDQVGSRLEGVSMHVAPISLGGSDAQTVLSDANGNYSFAGLVNSSYQITPSLAGFVFTPPTRELTINDQNQTDLNFAANSAVGTISLSSNKPSPQLTNIPGGVTFTAAVAAGTGPFEFQFFVTKDAVKTMVRDFATDPSLNLTGSTVGKGSFTVEVSVRQVGATSVLAEEQFTMSFTFTGDQTFTPGSYTISDALDSLRTSVQLNPLTPEKLARLDVAPFINAIPTPDGAIAINDALAILRMAVGLPPIP